MDDLPERAAALVKSWGAPAKLIRNGEARDCVAAVLDYRPGSKGLALEGALQVLIAAPLDVPPDHEYDKVWISDKPKVPSWTVGKLYQIPLPVKGPRPAGVVVYFDLTVVYESAMTL